MSQLSNDWPVVLGLILGIYGAVLSTILAIRGHFRDRWKVKVTCETGKVNQPRAIMVGDALEDFQDDVVVIKAINVGHRQVQITSMGFALSNKSQQFAVASVNGDRPLPKLLAEGDSVSIVVYRSSVVDGVHAEREKVSGGQVKLRYAFVLDTSGKEWKCALPKSLKELGVA